MGKLKRKLNDEHIIILERIGDNIPQELKDNLIKQEVAYPALKEIIERALKDSEVSVEQKKKFQMIKDSGKLDEMADVSDPVIEKKIDEYWNIEINKQIKGKDNEDIMHNTS